MKKQLFIKYIESLPYHAKILDAGCGKGNFLEYVRTIRKDLDFYGIDLISSKGIPKFINYTSGDICCMNHIPDDFFDCILCFHVLEHISEPQRATIEFYRTLKQGGMVMAECPHWMTTICPIGPNFYDDPTHIRPHNEKSMRAIFENFEKLHSGSGNPHEVHSMMNNISLSMLILGKIVSIFNLYRCSVYFIGRKKIEVENMEEKVCPFWNCCSDKESDSCGDCALAEEYGCYVSNELPKTDSNQ